VLQHVPFEGIGSIQPWMDSRGIAVSTARLFKEPALPLPGDFDWLIVMGGPMSANEEAVHPWLRPEKRLISQAIEAGKTVLGICLGAQLIASALGARVFPNECREIGWFPVRRPAGPVTDLARLFPDDIEVFHWHGETFELARGAVNFLESDVCENQAFSLGSRVLGLQFHLETTHSSAASLIENSRHEIAPSATIQTEQEMLARPERFAAINRLMDSLLNYLSGAAHAHME
jgi:GMP synthase-like glutamine amidotransferase